MKKFSKALLASVLLILLVISMVSCDSSDYTPNSSYNPGSSSQGNSIGVDRGTSVPMSEEIVTVTPKFTPAKDWNGYVTAAYISIKVNGKSKQYTYFNAKLTVTWTYNIISDAYPTGIDQVYTHDVVIDIQGDGSYKYTIPFEGCRDAKLISVEYEWSGTATKK